MSSFNNNGTFINERMYGTFINERMYDQQS